MTDGTKKSAGKGLSGGAVLIVCGILMLMVAGLHEVRYTLDGLETVSGTIISVDSNKPSRSSGYRLQLTLASGNSKLYLTQDEIGFVAGRLRPGQAIRAWVTAGAESDGDISSRTVWQIERGREVVISVLQVGDELHQQQMHEFGLAAFLLLSGIGTLVWYWPRQDLPDNPASH